MAIQNTNEEKGLLERVFDNKSKTQKATVNAILLDINLRENLDSQLIDKINDEILRLNNQILQFETMKNPYFFDNFNDINKLMIQLENNVQDLEQEKRKEHLECWRDLMMLRKYLLIAFKNYWDFSKKQEMLSNDLSTSLKDENRERCRGNMQET